MKQRQDHTRRDGLFVEHWIAHCIQRPVPRSVVSRMPSSCIHSLIALADSWRQLMIILFCGVSRRFCPPSSMHSADYALATYLPVYPETAVCGRHCAKTSKRINKRFYRRIATPFYSFSTPNVIAIFRRGPLNGGVEICDIICYMTTAIWRGFVFLCRILLPCPWYNFAQNVINLSVVDFVIIFFIIVLPARRNKDMYYLLIGGGIKTARDFNKYHL